MLLTEFSRSIDYVQLENGYILSTPTDGEVRLRSSKMLAPVVRQYFKVVFSYCAAVFDIMLLL